MGRRKGLHFGMKGLMMLSFDELVQLQDGTAAKFQLYKCCHEFIENVDIKTNAEGLIDAGYKVDVGIHADRESILIRAKIFFRSAIANAEIDEGIAIQVPENWEIKVEDLVRYVNLIAMPLLRSDMVRRLDYGLTSMNLPKTNLHIFENITLEDIAMLNAESVNAESL